MKTLDFLKDVEHKRKLAAYAAELDGKTRDFATHETLGECRKTLYLLIQDLQKGEIGIIMTLDAACLSIETSPGWMELLIHIVKLHEILIGDHTHDLVYDLNQEDDEAQFRTLYRQEQAAAVQRAPRALLAAIEQSPFAAAFIMEGENWFLVNRIKENASGAARYSLSSGANGKGINPIGVGYWPEIIEHLTSYEMSEEKGWSPLIIDQEKWLTLTHQQEDTMVPQTSNTMEAYRGSLLKGPPQGRVILSGTRKAHRKKKRK